MTTAPHNFSLDGRVALVTGGVYMADGGYTA